MELYHNTEKPLKLVQKHCAIFTKLYWADTWEGAEGVPLKEVSLYYSLLCSCYLTLELLGK